MDNWIKEGLLLRSAQKSTVIIMETWDPKRVDQFFQTMTNHKFKFGEGKENTFKNMFYYEPWKGLCKIEPTLTETGDDSNRFSPIQGKEGILQALKHVETHLKSSFTCFVLNNLFQKNDALTAAVRSWATDMEIYLHQSMIFIFTESASQIFDDATLRFVERVDVPVSTKEERKGVLSKISYEALNKREINPEIVRASAGLNLHQIESAALESIFREGKLSVKTISRIKTKMIKDSGVMEPVTVTRGFDAWGGYEVVKQYLKTAFIEPLSAKRKLAERLDMELPRGLLLHGPPGVGKTLAMQAISHELKIPVFKLGNTYSKFVGESERNIKAAVKVAEASSPCILYIDEIDKMGRGRSSSDHEVTRRVFSELLEWMGSKERKTIILGATNMPGDLDPAFVRPGRLDIKVPILYPDIDAREEIFRVHTSVVRKVPLQDVDLRALSEKTPLFSGAEIEQIVKNAQLEAFRENSKTLTPEHFDKALKSIEIDAASRNKEMEVYITEAKKIGCDRRFLKSLEDIHGAELSRVSAFLNLE